MTTNTPTPVLDQPTPENSRRNVAILIFTLAAVVLPVVLPTAVGIYGQPRTINEFTENSAAEAAGLQVGDRIVALDGHPANDFEKLRDYVGKRIGKPIAVTIQRDGQRLTIPVAPRPPEEAGHTVGRFGYKPKYPIDRYNPVSAVGKSAQT